METAVTTDCEQLEQLAAAENPTTALRAKIVLLALQGLATAEIAATLDISRKTVWRWRTRFERGGLPEVIRIPRRSGRKPTVRRSVETSIVETTLHTPAPNGKRWTTRLLAQTLGVSRAMVHRVWREAGIAPQLENHPPALPAAAAPLEETPATASTPSVPPPNSDHPSPQFTESAGLPGAPAPLGGAIWGVGYAAAHAEVENSKHEIRNSNEMRSGVSDGIAGGGRG